MRLLILIILPILGGLIAYLLPSIKGKASTIVIQSISVGIALHNFMEVLGRGSYSLVVGNYSEVAGITLTADLLSSVMILITASIFFLCIVYSIGNRKLESHFFFLYLVLQSCMTALFLTRDLFNIFVIIEVCTIIIAILIMYKNERSLYDSLIYLMNNTVAMIFFVFGIAVLYKNLHTLNLDQLAVRMTEAQLSGSYVAAYALLLTGICFKCALMPMFSWLPRAHAASGVPTVVSAILSSLYIKTGIFVFIRLRSIFLPLIDIDGYLLWITLATSLLGAILAVKQNNIKLILAYSTISQIGLIMSGILLGGYVSEAGALYHLVNHIIFKSTLFLCAGIYIKHYGHRDIRRMSGAFRSLPLVSTACIFALLGVTGAPFFNGSVSKYFIQYGAKGTVAEYVILLINTGTIFYFFRFFRMMGGKAEDSVSVEARCPFKGGSVAILGTLCLVGGIFSQRIMILVFGFDYPIDPGLYIQKALTYFATLLLCWIYFRRQGRGEEKNGALFSKRYSPSFNGISIMTCMFFMVTSMAILLINRV